MRRPTPPADLPAVTLISFNSIEIYADRKKRGRHFAARERESNGECKINETTLFNSGIARVSAFDTYRGSPPQNAKRMHVRIAEPRWCVISSGCINARSAAHE